MGRLWSALVASQAEIDDRFTASDDARERWDNDFPQWLQSESRKLFVAEDEESVCGFATVERWNPPPVYRDRPGVYLGEIFVDSAYRRRGHGRSLIDAAREWGRTIGAHELRAGVLARNEEGCRFWQQVGGEEIAKTFAMVLEPSRDTADTSRRRIGFRL